MAVGPGNIGNGADDSQAAAQINTGYQPYYPSETQVGGYAGRNPWQSLQTDSSRIAAGTNQSGAVTNPGTNPYTVQNPYLQSYSDAVSMNAAGQQAGQQQISSMQNQMSQYPALPNEYGLGDTSQFQGAVPGSQSNPSYMTSPLSTTVPDSGSRGFNPWSLLGESNAR